MKPSPQGALLVEIQSLQGTLEVELGPHAGLEKVQSPQGALEIVVGLPAGLEKAHPL